MKFILLWKKEKYIVHLGLSGGRKKTKWPKNCEVRDYLANAF